MKKILIAFTILISSALFYACKKQDAYVRHTTDEMAAKLYLTESFIRFSGNFITDFYQFADYLRVPAKQPNRNGFLTVLKEAAADESALENHLVRHHLSLDEWINRKNKLDNDLLQLFLQLPELRTYSDDEIIQIIKAGIQLGMTSQDKRWDDVRHRSVSQHAFSNVAIMRQGTHQLAPEVLDSYEVWDCLKDAVGLGAASILGIAGLKKLAGQGVQSIVISMSKFLAKYAGWIGLGIMVIDFSACLYHEYQD